MNIREMRPSDKEFVLSLAHDFYQSDAVEHGVDDAVLIRSFEAAVDEACPLKGYILEENATSAGYAYLSPFYSTEMGGMTFMLEELMVAEAYRGNGLGRQFLEWLPQRFPEIRRFRLEVTAANERAAALYRRVGFRPLMYDQMVWDFEEEEA